jgi:hypothetical protein
MVSDNDKGASTSTCDQVKPRLPSLGIIDNMADNRAGIAQWYRMIGGVGDQTGLRIFLYTTAYRPALGPT